MSRHAENIHKRKEARGEARFRFPIISSYKSSKLTFGELLDQWLDSSSYKIKKSSLYKYEYLIEQHIKPELGTIKICHLTGGQVQQFINKKINNGRIGLEGGLSTSYVKSMLIIIRSASKYAGSCGYFIPTTGTIKFPVNETKNFKVLDLEYQTKLEKYLAKNLNHTTLGIMLSLYAGLRIGEICALKWQDIDFQNNTICVRHTVSRIKNEEGNSPKTVLIIDTPKTASSKRDIPISSLLLPRLKYMKEKSSSDYVISETPSFTPPRTFEYRYHRILQDCDIPSVNYHALRHTFATRCVEAEGEVKSLSEILGHSNVSTTLNTYVHSSMKLKRIQIEKMTHNSSLKAI